MKHMTKRIRAASIALAFALGLTTLTATEAHASVVYLPVVEKSVGCGGLYGYAQAWFLQDTGTGRRRPYRGGFRMTNYGISQFQAIGVVGGNAYANPAISFPYETNKASQYIPTTAPWGPINTVSISPGILVVEGSRRTRCVWSIASN